MEELVKNATGVVELGILVTIATFFLWEKMHQNKITQQTMESLQKSIDILQRAVETLSDSTRVLTSAVEATKGQLIELTHQYSQHLTITEYMNADIRDIHAIVVSKSEPLPVKRHKPRAQKSS